MKRTEEKIVYFNRFREATNYMDINMGIIGYGGMARWHKENAPRAGVQVIAAYDIEPKQVDDAIKDGLKGYYTLEEFLSDQNYSLVLVATPNHVHKALSVAAMNAGKNVICEKPVAMSVTEVDEMIEASKKNNVIFTVHQNRRWDKDYKTIKHIYESGELGKIFSVQSRLYGSGGLVNGWRGFPEFGGGMVLDWGVHFLDQFLYMIPAKVTSVYACTHSVINPEVDDYFNIILQFDNGITAQTELGTFMLTDVPRWYVAGDMGTAIIQDFNADKGSITKVSNLARNVEPVIIQTAAGPTRTFAPQPPETKVQTKLPSISTDWVEFYRNVVAAMTGKEKLIVKPCEVRRVFSLIEAVFKSSKLNKTIQFEN